MFLYLYIVFNKKYLYYLFILFIIIKQNLIFINKKYKNKFFLKSFEFFFYLIFLYFYLTQNQNNECYKYLLS